MTMAVIGSIRDMVWMIFPLFFTEPWISKSKLDEDSFICVQRILLQFSSRNKSLLLNDKVKRSQTFFSELRENNRDEKISNDYCYRQKCPENSEAIQHNFRGKKFPIRDHEKNKNTQQKSLYKYYEAQLLIYRASNKSIYEYLKPYNTEKCSSEGIKVPQLNNFKEPLFGGKTYKNNWV